MTLISTAIYGVDRPTYILGFLRPEDINDLPDGTIAFSDRIADIMADAKGTMFYDKDIAEEIGDLEYRHDYAEAAKMKFCKDEGEIDPIIYGITIWRRDNNEVACVENNNGDTTCGGNGHEFYLTREEVAEIVGLVE